MAKELISYIFRKLKYLLVVFIIAMIVSVVLRQYSFAFWLLVFVLSLLPTFYLHFKIIGWAQRNPPPVQYIYFGLRLLAGLAGVLLSVYLASLAEHWLSIRFGL